MNLYDQLLKLQVMENAYAEWTSYREEVTDFIIQEAEENKSIAVLGAGRCNDINLNRLTEQFHKVILIDKDEKALLEGIQKQQVKENRKIEIEIRDFVGISQEDYRTYADLLVNEVRRTGGRVSGEVLAKQALNWLEQLDENLNKEALKLGMYETSIAIGVHSQLLSMLEWIWSVILQTVGQDEMSVRNKIISLNTKYVERFNKALTGATRDRLIIGCEEQRTGRTGSIQGAFQAMKDIKRRVGQNELKLLKEKSLQWPFNHSQGIIYQMKFVVLEKPHGLNNNKK